MEYEYDSLDEEVALVILTVGIPVEVVDDGIDVTLGSLDDSLDDSSDGSVDDSNDFSVVDSVEALDGVVRLDSLVRLVSLDTLGIDDFRSAIRLESPRTIRYRSP